MLRVIEAVAQQSDTAVATAFSGTFLIIVLACVVLSVAGVWMTYQKAGQPGWAAIVPIYNIVILMRVAGKPGWWTLLFFVPVVNLIIAIIAQAAVAKNFGRGVGFALGLIFLGPIFYCILGFGDSQYQPV